MTRVRVTETGLREVVLDLEGIADRSKDFKAAVPMLRARWGESEARILSRRVGWAPRLASTRRRYQWPVDGRRASPTVGRVSGRMIAGLSNPTRAMIRQDVAGNLSVTFGPKQRGPIAHANFFSAGRGGQVARPAIDFDDRGLEDAANDVTGYMIGVGTHASRR